MVVVAQLVRAPDCGSGGRRFETDLPPRKTKPSRNRGLFLWNDVKIRFDVSSSDFEELKIVSRTQY